MDFKAYLLRLRPSHAQKRMLERTLELCCEVYNYLLDEQIAYFLANGRIMSAYDLNALLPPLKKEHEEYNEVNARTLQNLSVRVYRSSVRWSSMTDRNGFYRLPRHKRKSRMRSFAYTAPEDFTIFRNSIRFSKMKKDESIRFKCNQHLRGEFRTCTVVRRKNSWLCYVGCNVPERPLPTEGPAGETVGADLGLHTLITLSDGKNFDRFIPEQKVMNQLENAQRRLSECPQDTPEYEKWYRRLINKHERIANKRNNYLRHVARYLAENYGTIAVEDIELPDLIHSEISRGLRRSQYNAGWGQLVKDLYQAAKSTGTSIVPVDPFCTSQLCCMCNAYVRKDLSVRTHECWNCGLVMDRDRNASFNVLRMAVGCTASDLIRKQREKPPCTILF
ncbi:MAG: transposase [archaeon]|nr:transposase [archaeon]